jgi:thioredoxin reductase
VVLAEGKNPALAIALGLEQVETGIVVDTDYRSSMDRVYVVGRSARLKRSQAIISAGAGAVAALDILAREAGTDVQDWDTPPKEEAAVAS